MHFKKYFYIEGVHIKLIFKNNLLRCYVYNYSNEDKYIACEMNKIITSERKPLTNDRMFLLKKKAFILSNEMTLSDIQNNTFYLAFDLFDNMKRPIMYNEYQRPFTEAVEVAITD